MRYDAENVTGLKHSTEFMACDDLRIVPGVGERSLWNEAVPVRSGGLQRSDYIGISSEMMVRIHHTVSRRFPCSM